MDNIRSARRNSGNFYVIGSPNLGVGTPKLGRRMMKKFTIPEV